MMALLKLSQLMLRLSIPKSITPLIDVRATIYCSIFNFKPTAPSDKFDKYVEHIEREYQNIGCNNPTDMSYKRSHELESIIKLIEKRKSLLNDLAALGNLSDENDKNLDELIREERSVYEEKLSGVKKQLVDKLTEDDLDNCHTVLFEVSAGVGGQEAMLFASELFDMYRQFIEYKGWSYETADCDTSELKGIRHAKLLVTGMGVYKSLKHEAGVHRVQRIPTTEKSGRVHTSTVSVAVLAQTDEININISEKDLRIDTKRASGAGGQHVNTTDSAVRIVHLPTGLIVECQTDRSQIKNKQIAMQRLKAKLYQRELEAKNIETQTTRKAQVGSSLRNEKIRTYNYSQDRITDHRLQHSVHNLKGFLSGGDELDDLIEKLDSETKRSKLDRLIENVLIEKL